MSFRKERNAGKKRGKSQCYDNSARHVQRLNADMGLDTRCGDHSSYREVIFQRNMHGSRFVNVFKTNITKEMSLSKHD